MHPHAHNPFDTRPPGNPDTAKFLAALGDQQAAEAYRQVMGEEARPSTTDDQEPQLTTDELARLQAAEAALRDTREKKDLAALKADYLAWAREFGLGGYDPQEWIDETFTFNQDGTVEVGGNLDLFNKSLTHLPPALTRVNGHLYLWSNQLTSLEGLPQEIHGLLNISHNQLTSLDGLPQEIHGHLNISSNQLTSLDGLPQEIYGDLFLGGNPLTSLEGLRGKKIDGDLNLKDVPAQSIPEGIELGGKVIVRAGQTVLKQDAISKGYTVHE